MVGFYYVLNMIEFYLNFILYKCFFIEKKWVNSITLTILNIIFTLLRVGLREWIHSRWINSSYSIIICFLICLFCFEAPVKMKIICTSFFSFLWVCLDIVIPISISATTRIDITAMIDTEAKEDFLFFLFILIKFIIIQLLRKKMNPFYFEREGNLYIFQTIVPIISCLSITYLANSEISEKGFIRTYMMMIILGIINIIQYYVLGQLNKLQIEKMEQMKITEIYKYKDEYYQEIESRQQEIRKIKHDLKNQFILLKTYLDNKKYRLATREIVAMLQDVVTIEEYIFTRNQVVNALLNTKIKQANEMDINCDISVKLPEQMNIIDRDMINLLGNLLDNCIESCVRVDGERFLKLTIFYQNGVVLIQSKNITDINEVVLNTRKKSKMEHGIGLKSIQTIIEKYNGNLKIEIVNYIFNMEIIMWDIKKMTKKSVDLYKF